MTLIHNDQRVAAVFEISLSMHDAFNVSISGQFGSNVLKRDDDPNWESNHFFSMFIPIEYAITGYNSGIMGNSRRNEVLPQGDSKNHVVFDGESGDRV